MCLGFNSLHFIRSNITKKKCASAGFTICTHTTSLTFDLTSDQEKLPQNRENKLLQGKKGRNLQESNRGGSLSRMDRRIDAMCTGGIITELHEHIQ